MSEITPAEGAIERRATIGLAQGTALYVGAVVGTGVLTLPALAARQAGPASLVAWIAMVVLSVPLALTFAALASRYPDSGGIATFARHAFGSRWAAVTGWWFYFLVPGGIPVLGLFAGVYVAAAVGGGRTTAVVVSFILIAITAVGNWFGVRVSGRLQLVLVGGLIILLSLAVATSISQVHMANMEPFLPGGWLAVGVAATMLVWSFAGWEAVTHLAGEFVDPTRDLLRATIAALSIVGVIYIGVAGASVLVLGPELQRTDAPIAELLARGFGGGSELVTGAATATAILLTLGTMNTYMAAAAKLGAALGRDGALPRWFASGSEPGELPRMSLLALNLMISLVLGLISVTALDTQVIVQLETACIAAIYAVGCAAGVRLLPRSSAHRTTAAVALVAVLGLLALSGPFLLWPVVLALGALWRHERRQSNSWANGAEADGVPGTGG